MWKTSFVATALAIGDDVDGAMGAISPAPAGLLPASGDPLDALVANLRAPQRVVRAQALAEAIRVVALALDEVTLR